MPNLGQRIQQAALEILRQKPDGMRYANLARAIAEADPSLKINTIHGSIWDLDRKFPDRIEKPARGLFRLVEFGDSESSPISLKPTCVKEEDFYEPFADWLVNDMEECTKAIALGGNEFKDKWGTPDVIGKRESKRSDIIQAPVEIVSAEIKLEPTQLVTAIGQACAHCLFSHRSYLVVPGSAPQEELSRLDSLCQVFGLGLVLYDSSSPMDPAFEIRARPVKQDPDLFYANKYMRIIESRMFA